MKFTGTSIQKRGEKEVAHGAGGVLEGLGVAGLPDFGVLAAGGWLCGKNRGPLSPQPARAINRMAFEKNRKKYRSFMDKKSTTGNVRAAYGVENGIIPREWLAIRVSVSCK